jgi:hypothetical protein
VRGADRRWELGLVLGLGVGPAAIGLPILYASGLSVGAFFLVGGWLSIVATGYLLYRAAQEVSLAAGSMAAPVDGSVSAQRRHELEREKKLLLKAIKEAEFDHEMGKLDDRDADELTRGYRARALEIMHQLDASRGDRDYALVVEKELVRRLAKQSGAPAGAGEGTPALEPTAVPSATVTLEPSIAVEARCAKCDVKNDLDALFCKKCGTKLG